LSSSSPPRLSASSNTLSVHRGDNVAESGFPRQSTIVHREPVAQPVCEEWDRPWLGTNRQRTDNCRLLICDAGRDRRAPAGGLIRPASLAPDRPVERRTAPDDPMRRRSAEPRNRRSRPSTSFLFW